MQLFDPGRPVGIITRGTERLIPAWRVMPLVHDYLRNTPMDVLAERSHVSISTIRSVVEGSAVYVTFSTVDALLTAMDSVEEWHLSLADVYRDV